VRLDTREVRKSRRRSTLRPWRFIVRKLKQYQIYVLIAFGVCVLIAAGFVLARSSRVDANEWRKEIILAGQQAIRNAVKEEIRTSFAGTDETQFEVLPGDKYRLGGWVDLISDEGKIARQNFSCILYRNANDDWVAQDVSVIPQ
jgi:hypothetical protein